MLNVFSCYAKIQIKKKIMMELIWNIKILNIKFP